MNFLKTIFCLAVRLGKPFHCTYHTMNKMSTQATVLIAPCNFY